MRLGKFESAGKGQLGEGSEKKVYADPRNPDRVIAEIKTREGVEKDSPRLLKATFYLTKIAHLLLPENVPDIHQSGEDTEGTQTIDRERVELSPEHQKLQDSTITGEEIAEIEKVLNSQVGGEMSDVSSKLSELGFGFAIDDRELKNFTKGSGDAVHYLDTFKPWEIDVVDPHKLEMLIDIETLQESIDALQDEALKSRCNEYLGRIQVLFEEEQAQLDQN